ncbi:TetR/AcrR family transcriptional regulator [Bacillus thermotolerans]|uniref:Transcriptional regulator, TetR family n=1 Tax=Bacillus thermotolerans TaxID=1221996 RepID=A0A0F5I7W1_BACTR|nr:TetR/AcrR family transcriptional regulator [Bacillus thermotolerans]KKB34073.1 Transcriptional regulator, TetR family [Bacillus thermotolerans]KKB41488.1 Transcriptional regulator, TetR family [Bacillus thermotolerans]KKB41528.1 Transcriptional regulator, TetR family [Bacillus thermotolerans]
MYEAFEKQPQAKKELILQVAVEEFAEKGYDKASTDVITQRAGISKGILFHYFKSKKNLYVYVVSHLLDILSKQVAEAIQHTRADDFFERIKEIVRLKQEVLKPYRKEVQLVTDAFFHTPAAVLPEMEAVMNRYYETHGQEFRLETVYLPELIAEQKLRPGVTKEKVIHMTSFIVDQLTAKYQVLYKKREFDLFNQPEPMMKELDDYLDIVKHGVYKQE